MKVFKKLLKLIKPKQEDAGCVIIHQTKKLSDQFGEYDVPFTLTRFKNKSGKVKYNCRVSDFSCTDDDMLDVITECVFHLYEDPPCYYRLKESLEKRK